MKAFEVTSSLDMTKVWELTYSAYLEMGYCEPNDSGILRHYPHLDLIPETKVFAIEDSCDCGLKETIIQATCSYTIDGPNGLHVDHMFLDETNEVRKECAEKGLKLGSAWRIVTRQENRKIETLLNLINITLDSGFKEADVCLFTFHPKHAKIYARILDLYTIAGPKDDTSVNGSPAVLMRGDIVRMVERWKKVFDVNVNERKHRFMVSWERLFTNPKHRFRMARALRELMNG